VLALSDSAGSSEVNQVSVGFKCSPIVAGIDAKNRSLEVVSGNSIRGESHYKPLSYQRKV